MEETREAVLQNSALCTGPVALNVCMKWIFSSAAGIGVEERTHFSIYLLGNLLQCSTLFMQHPSELPTLANRIRDLVLINVKFRI